MEYLLKRLLLSLGIHQKGGWKPRPYRTALININLLYKIDNLYNIDNTM